jgi:hypothetical protein
LNIEAVKRLPIVINFSTIARTTDWNVTSIKAQNNTRYVALQSSESFHGSQSFVSSRELNIPLAENSADGFRNITDDVGNSRLSNSELIADNSVWNPLCDMIKEYSESMPRGNRRSESCDSFFNGWLKQAMEVFERFSV